MARFDEPEEWSDDVDHGVDPLEEMAVAEQDGALCPRCEGEGRIFEFVSQFDRRISERTCPVCDGYGVRYEMEEAS